MMDIHAHDAATEVNGRSSNTQILLKDADQITASDPATSAELIAKDSGPFGEVRSTNKLPSDHVDTDEDASSVSSFNFAPPQPRPPPMPKCEVARIGALDFKRHKFDSVVEVLLGEARVTIQASEGDVRSSTAPVVKPNPKRIRIRSYVIRFILEDLAREQGRSFMESSGSVFASVDGHMTFLQPFKLFSDLEAEIRAKAVDLQETIKADNERIVSLSSPPPVADDLQAPAASKSDQPVLESMKCKECGQERKDTYDKPRLARKNESPDSVPLRGKKNGKSTAAKTRSRVPPAVLPPPPQPTIGIPPPPPPPAYLQLEHLKLLIEVFDNDLKPMFDLRREIREGTLKRIAFEDLWHLYTVGQDVRLNTNDSRIYRVLRATGGRPVLSPLPPGMGTETWSLNFYINAVFLDFNGRSYGPSYETFVISKYDGDRPVTSLTAYPTHLGPKHQEFRGLILQRSKKWLDLAQPNLSSHKHYSGLTLDPQNPEEVDSQIIVDNRMAFLNNHSQASATSQQPHGGNMISHNHGETFNDAIPDSIHASMENNHQDYMWDAQKELAYLEQHVSWLATTSNLADFKDSDKVLFPPHLEGFVLRTRKWAIFNVDNIFDVTYPSGFDKLVLPPGHDKTVRALVARHAQFPSTRGKDLQSESPSMDLVRGKGEGLVILLHGAPGVGKTSTAECVADTTKRPLFPITCGDIGDTATEVERNLEKSFQLAHKWGCVLLLDEADIFLQKRDKHDIKRNAIVSVFLRTLEYYRGILFLTTNRVGTFDPAFRSRIHISLFYPRLRKDATLKIWKMHLDRTQELKGDRLKFDRKEILEFAKDHYLELKKAHSGVWNGRQIRNAFQTAIALAEFQASDANAKHSTDENYSRRHRVELSTEHFKIVAQTSKDFDLYLRSTLGGQTESDLAKREQTRLDEYSPSPKTRRRGRNDKEKGGKRGKVNVHSEEGDSEDTVDESGDSEDEESDSEDASKGASDSEEVEATRGKAKSKGKKSSR